MLTTWHVFLWYFVVSTDQSENFIFYNRPITGQKSSHKTKCDQSQFSFELQVFIKVINNPHVNFFPCNFLTTNNKKEPIFSIFYEECNFKRLCHLIMMVNVCCLVDWSGSISYYYCVWNCAEFYDYLHLLATIWRNYRQINSWYSILI